ncbi:uncharacterized protein LOC142345489 [Convolutriloba macropyga]|uniref:uncharacterized protein LOC142345489 n=1 Tax=Convolutriloba macropyga TaxID=536237 RepID=UPI003F52107B
MQGAQINTIAVVAEEGVDISAMSSSESVTDATPGDLELLATANSRYRRIEESALTDEERERLLLRRERNKQAAARCRNRRRDLTATLEQQAEEWQQKNADLENEIADLMSQKEQLEFLLNMHESQCNQLGTQTQYHTSNDTTYDNRNRASISSVTANVTRRTVNAFSGEAIGEPVRGTNEMGYNADIDDDLSSGLAFKQEPEDLSIKTSGKNQPPQYPSNLIINPITSSSVILNNNTHYYVSQYSASSPSVGCSSATIRTCPPLNKSSNKEDRLLTVEPHANFSQSPRRVNAKETPIKVAIASPPIAKVTPTKRDGPHAQPFEYSSPVYSPGGYNTIRTGPIDKTPPRAMQQSPGRAAVPLLCDSPRAMQKQSQYQVQFNNSGLLQQSHQMAPSPVMSRVPKEDSGNIYGHATDPMASGATGVSLLEDGHSLINEFFEDDSAKHFSAL